MARIECYALGFAPLDALEDLKVTLTGIAGRKLRTYQQQEWLLVREEDRASSVPRSEMKVTYATEYEVRLLGRIQRDFDICRAQAVTHLESIDDPQRFLEALGYKVQSQSSRAGFAVESLEHYTVRLFAEEGRVRVELQSICQEENLEDYLRVFGDFAKLLSPAVTYTIPA